MRPKVERKLAHLMRRKHGGRPDKESAKQPATTPPGRVSSSSTGFVALGAVCDTCAGEVTSNPSTGEPNAQCKACYLAAKATKATKQQTDAGHLNVMRSLINDGWGNQHGIPGNNLDPDELADRFGGDQAALTAAKSLRWKFGNMNNRDALDAWKQAYAEARGSAS